MSSISRYHILFAFLTGLITKQFVTKQWFPFRQENKQEKRFGAVFKVLRFNDVRFGL
jgi:hypothetical protein